MPALDRRLTRESTAARRQLYTSATLAAADAILIVAQAALLAAIIAGAVADHRGLGALRTRLLALAAVLLARAAVHAGFGLSGRIGAINVMSHLRARLVTALLLDRPGHRPGGTRTGELATAATAGVEALEAYFAGYLPQLMLAAVVPIAVLAWVATLDPLVAALLAATVPILVAFMVLVGNDTRVKTRRRYAALALLSAHFLDVISGLETLRSYRREKAQHATLAAVGDRYRSETMATLRLAFMSALVLELCAMLGTAVAAAAIGVELCAGALSLQTGLTVLILVPELYAPLRELGQQFHASADASAASERIFAAVDATPTPSRSGPRSIVDACDPGADVVAMRRACFAYPGSPAPVLDEVDLELRPGQITALQGPSGAGKSTIARLLMALDAPSSGAVLCGTQDIDSFDRERWWSQLAWLPQRCTMFACTVADNVRLGAPAASTGDVHAALAAAGADRFVAGLPDGIDTIIGEGGRRLSAGQARRIGLARLIARDARLLIVDEPTAHLDPDTAAMIARRLPDAMRGRTVLLITHDPRLAAIADRQLWLEDGRITPGVAPAAIAADHLEREVLAA